MPYPSMPMSGVGNMGPPSYAQTPRPMTVVDRFRQNGRPGGDDSPLRTPSSLFAYWGMADNKDQLRQCNTINLRDNHQ
jgi:hypothetical protein